MCVLVGELLLDSKPAVAFPVGGGGGACTVGQCDWAVSSRVRRNDRLVLPMKIPILTASSDCQERARARYAVENALLSKMFLFVVYLGRVMFIHFDAQVPAPLWSLGVLTRHGSCSQAMSILVALFCSARRAFSDTAAR